MENLVNIGTIIGTHHLVGTVKVNSIFQEIELIVGEKVLIEKNDQKRVLTIKDVRRLNDRKLLVNFEEIKVLQHYKNKSLYHFGKKRYIIVKTATIRSYGG